MREVFDRIYETNAWEGTESCSGIGAGTIAKDHIAGPLAALVKELGVSSVLDVGCGDGFWMPELPGYIGLDVSARAIELSRARHPQREYRLDDGSPYPDCEMVLTRCAMQHLSLADGLAMLDRVRATTATWFLATSYMQGLNEDIVTGGGYWPDLRVAPFNLGEPLRVIVDGQSDRMKKGCVLGLWGP